MTRDSQRNQTTHIVSHTLLKYMQGGRVRYAFVPRHKTHNYQTPLLLVLPREQTPQLGSKHGIHSRLCACRFTRNIATMPPTVRQQ